jgi:ferredoxin-NADP reductase
MIKVNVTSIVHWSDRTFSIKTTRDESFRFESGEFAMIGMMSDKYKKNVIRAYSVVSPPWAENLEFLSIKNVGPLTTCTLTEDYWNITKCFSYSRWQTFIVVSNRNRTRTIHVND